MVRTIFLLRYVSDVELRKSINSATNENEEFNRFTKWAFFGGEGVIAENLMVEPHKVIEYNQLVSNMLIVHNAVEMAEVIKQLQDEGTSDYPGRVSRHGAPIELPLSIGSEIISSIWKRVNFTELTPFWTHLISYYSTIRHMPFHMGIVFLPKSDRNKIKNFFHTLNPLAS